MKAHQDLGVCHRRRLKRRSAPVTHLEFEEQRRMLERKRYHGMKISPKRKKLLGKYGSDEITALKPMQRDHKNITVRHKTTFEKLKLLRVFEGIITAIHGNDVCFQDEFLIGRGSYGTEVYICLGFDGKERAIKRLPKHLCKKFLKNERDILNSGNAIDSPQIVNYWFYDDTSNPDFGYLILDLYEQSLEEYINEKGKTMTETDVQKMIRQILQGLKALHSREPRILHRDLKPSNILVDVNGDVALSDFGIGRFFPEEGMRENNIRKYNG